MAQQIAKLNTRILVATGDAEPVEVGTIECDIYTRTAPDGINLVLNARKWRRALAAELLRMAWSTWTMKDEQ